MHRRIALLLATAPALLAAASGPVGKDAPPIDGELQRARSEARAAEAEMKRLEQSAGRARDEVAKLAAERQSAAAAIAASEARISAADVEVRLADALVADRRARLERRQAPLASLIAGIVSMGSRPPLLSIADGSSLEEFVRVRALLDTTLPVIRARSAALSAELSQGRKLQAAAAAARDHLFEAKAQLQERQKQFAELEARAGERAARLGAGAVSAGDVYVASSESEATLLSASARRAAELKLAAELGGLGPAPRRPGGAGPLSPPLAYRLPVDAPVTEGLGAVSDTGIRSRGLTLNAYAGQDVAAPADGTIAFAGPFRRHDGIVIIDHGQGWMTLITGIRTDLRKGERVRLGELLGKALGVMTVELSTNGRPVSAALIAGSSHLLSIKGKSG